MNDLMFIATISIILIAIYLAITAFMMIQIHREKKKRKQLIKEAEERGER